MRTNKDLILILGNQLFPPSLLKAMPGKDVYMAEDHGLCTHFRYHKHKIILFLAAMRAYADELKQKGYSVHYEQLSQKTVAKSYFGKLATFLKKRKKGTVLHTFEVEDHFFESQLQDFCIEHGVELVVHPSPMFMVTRQRFEEYLAGVKKPFMKTFYEQMRRETGILMAKKGEPEGGKFSFDADNRKKLPKDIELPSSPVVTKQPACVEEVKELVEDLFPDHPGKVEEFWLPVTRRVYLNWLNSFIAERFESYGDYQDAITSRSDFVFHSLLSPGMNMGLITPAEVLDAVAKADVPMNSKEGFIRQVLGWREFVRGIYHNFDDHQQKTNFFAHKRKLTDAWYQGTTGIPPLDDSINKAQRTGYSHHIERLMIQANMMVLCEIHPQEAYKWFMEMFVDSSDWVMGPNVFGMGIFSDGGVFATKPYICGSNYWLKMSDTYKKGEWCDAIDGLYWRFISNNREFFGKNPRLSMMVRTLDRMQADKAERLSKAANAFLEKHTAP